MSLLVERHIGIDQGVKNFAIAVVERSIGKHPNVVAAKNYTDLQLKTRFKAADVLVALSGKTDLLFWMNPTNGDEAVDRVVVHLEQIDRRNQNSKQFAIQLGKLLQQQAIDTESCIVQMSSPRVHRSSGPLFQLGDEIVETLQLQPATSLQQRSTADSNPAVLSCLSWIKENLQDFVENRREIVDETEKRTFFHAILKLPQSDERGIEMLQLSDTVKTKLCSNEVAIQIEHDKTFQRNIADLVLVAMSKNQQHVKAIAANSRKISKVTKPTSPIEEDDAVEH